MREGGRPLLVDWYACRQQKTLGLYLFHFSLSFILSISHHPHSLFSFPLSHSTPPKHRSCPVYPASSTTAPRTRSRPTARSICLILLLTRRQLSRWPAGARKGWVL